MAPAVAGVAGLLLLFAASAVQKIWGLDFWWQLAAGRWMVEQGRTPAVDVLSHSAAGKAWIEVRWLFCVGLYAGWRAGGAGLLIAAQTLWLLLMWGLVAWRVRRAAWAPTVLLALGLGIAAGLSRWVIRPEVVSYGLSALFLVWLDAARRERSAWARRWVWALPLVQVVWANASTLFALGPALCWAFALGDGAERWWRTRDVRRAVDWRLVGVAAAVTAACWVNPWFHEGAMFPLMLLGQIQEGHVVSAVIGEMARPLSMPWSAWTLDLELAAALAVLGVVSFGAAGLRGGLDVPRALVFLAGLYLAAQAQRNAGILAVWAAWAALRNFEDAGLASAGAARSGRWASAALGLAWAGLAWYVASDRWFRAIGAPRETGVGVVWWNTPREAAEFVAGAGAQGPLFNGIRDGGYLAWRLQDGRAEGLKVFSDGRLEVYGPEFVGGLALLSPATWDGLERAHGFNTLVVPVSGNEELVNMLAGRRDRWALVHADHRNVVFARVMPGHEGLIEGHRLRLGVPWTKELPDETAPGWKRAIGGVSRPWSSVGMGQTMLALGAVDRAAEFFALALERFPGHGRATAMLAALERFRGNTASGDALYDGLRDRAWRIASDEELTRLLTATGRFGEAAAAARRLVDLEPTARDRRLLLGDVAHNAEEFGTAADAYIAAAEMGGADAGLWAKIGHALERSGSVREAMNAYRQSLAMEGSRAWVWTRVGGLHESAGEVREAAGAYRRALEIDASDEGARRGLERLGAPGPG